MSGVVATDVEISDAIRTWIDQHIVLPSETTREPIVVFRREDGTRGTVYWDGEKFLYVCMNDERWTEIPFTEEFYHMSAVPVIPFLHERAVWHITHAPK